MDVDLMDNLAPAFEGHPQGSSSHEFFLSKFEDIVTAVDVNNVIWSLLFDYVAGQNKPILVKQGSRRIRTLEISFKPQRRLDAQLTARKGLVSRVVVQLWNVREACTR